MNSTIRESDFQNLILMIYNNAKAKGFHEDWTIEKKLALIISELGEGLEADRQLNYFHMNKIENFGESIFAIEDQKYFEHTFKNIVKDTFEDELADVYIRVLDLFSLLVIGYPFQEDRMRCFEIDVFSGVFTFGETNTAEGLFYLMKKAAKLNEPDDRLGNIADLLSCIRIFAKHQNVNLDLHVQMKMRFNLGRPYKHGVQY